MVFASLFFYSWWNIIYLPLILGSILFNFTVGSTITKMDKTTKKMISRRTVLFVGILSNILLLGYFKYMDFFISNINTFLGLNLELMHIVLPLGISFFTFTQIAYLVDSYRNEVREMDYLNYTLFVTFFPHLLAGPILHHKEMMPQFDSIKTKVINYRNISAGLFLFSIGLFKKTVMADTFAIWADTGFDHAMILTFTEAWITSLSYTFQLYFDFSGYTDMALGTALIFNIKLPFNFNSPYKATNIQDFWRRWHMTLSRFLKDYIYIPLGGNKNGHFRTYLNLVITFIIGGLWHGAGWTFLFWGFLHGIALAIHRIWQKLGWKLYPLIGWFLTFNFVNTSWVFFRAKEWDDALKIINAMYCIDNTIIKYEISEISKFMYTLTDWQFHLRMFFTEPSAVEMIIIGFFITIFTSNSNTLLKKFKFSLLEVFFVVFTIILFHFMQINCSKSIFLYFNF